MTRQRRVILEELQRVRSHPCADEIHTMVRRRLPRVSLATVYRNLEILAECGEIRKLSPTATQRRFDGDTSPHYHVRCTECGQVDDVTLPPLTVVEDILLSPIETNYEILGYQLELIGLCPRCRKTESPGRADRVGSGETS